MTDDKARHAWKCDTHDGGCTVRFFDAYDNPCRSKSPDECCACGRSLKPAVEEPAA